MWSITPRPYEQRVSREDENGLWTDPTNGKKYFDYDPPTQAPGDCLFFAMADQLRQLGLRPRGVQELRKLAVNTQRKTDYPANVGKNERALSRMLKQRTYGTGHELAALSLALNVNVRILQIKGTWLNKGGNEGIWLDPYTVSNNLPTARVMLYFKSHRSARNHYSSMRENLECPGNANISSLVS